MTDNNGLKNLLSQESREKALKSPKQIGEKVRVTAAPIYLLAKAELNQLEHQLSYCTILSPVTGVVSHRVRITAVSPLVEQTGMVRMEAILPPHPHFKPGMTVIVTLAE